MARFSTHLGTMFRRYLLVNQQTSRSLLALKNRKMCPGTSITCGGLWLSGRPQRWVHASPFLCLNRREGGDREEALALERKEEGGLVSLEDLVFRILSSGQQQVALRDFFAILAAKGLRQTDPRLQESFSMIREKFSLPYSDTMGDTVLDKEGFHECISENIVLIGRALRNMFIIPEFLEFTAEIDRLHEEIKHNEDGEVASYIPQLARQNPNYWGISLCTIDGQRHSVGDTEVPFCLQSCSKAPIYTETLTRHGAGNLHKYIGHEPSGRTFNDLNLDEYSKPHNPMNNAGAILVLSLLDRGSTMADRFDNIMQRFKEMAGGEYIGFSNATFLSEKESGYRNYALCYLLQEYGCFPKGVNPMETLELYFQVCSLEITCESGSVIAATLANGGICPMTGNKVFDPAAVRDTLTVMSSCGMYDYSGQFAFKVGMPAKSGVSGGIMVVIPNVMGFMLYSPPLDRFGNSVRGGNFCENLVGMYNFHNYDNLLHATRKRDPRRQKTESRASRVVKLLFAAYNGDVSILRQYLLQGEDMEQMDYDNRTALHVGAAEGHMDVVLFLLEKCKVAPDPIDRWGRTPVEDAERFGHIEVAEILRDIMSN